MELDEPRYLTRDELSAVRARGLAGARLEGLWAAGDIGGLRGPTVAVVGSRAPSEGARRRAHDLGTALARAGTCVISGLAHGIDGAAHAGALAGGGATIGVLGGGHRQFYPARHRELALAMIAGGGAVLSPFAPDDPARPPQFLQRNGIVTALADAVVIVEAAARSGALNTASWAAQLGIAVLAYPGDVDRPKAAGCNALIRDGATLVRDAADVFEALGLHSAGLPEALPLPFRADPLERAVLALLDGGSADFETLALGTAAASSALLATLVRLEIEGLVTRDASVYARGA